MPVCAGTFSLSVLGDYIHCGDWNMCCVKLCGRCSTYHCVNKSVQIHKLLDRRSSVLCWLYSDISFETLNYRKLKKKIWAKKYTKTNMSQPASQPTNHQQHRNTKNKKSLVFYVVCIFRWIHIYENDDLFLSFIKLWLNRNKNISTRSFQFSFGARLVSRLAYRILAIW